MKVITKSPKESSRFPTCPRQMRPWLNFSIWAERPSPPPRPHGNPPICPAFQSLCWMAPSEFLLFLIGHISPVKPPLRRPYISFPNVHQAGHQSFYFLFSTASHLVRIFVVFVISVVEYSNMRGGHKTFMRICCPDIVFMERESEIGLC